MRLKSNIDLENKKKKIFLSFEGVKTEVQYFDKIIENRDILNINIDFDIILMLRNHTFLGWSNPLKAFKRTKFCIDNLSRGQRNVSSFISSIVEFCFYNSHVISTKDGASSLYDSLIKLIEDNFKLNKDNNFDFTTPLANNIKESIVSFISKSYKIEGLDLFIDSQFILFNPDRDDVCLIVDRDSRSVSNKQYDKLIKKCEINNFKLFVSNPCFEFWLLLHFNEVFDIDTAELLDNKKLIIDDNEIHFCEYELKKILPDFEKNNICFSSLINRINIAIKNEKRFEETLLNLKTNLGSNVGQLLKILVDKS
jgi:hypothetical protein